METPSHPSELLVRIENLSRLYGETLAVNQVSFELKRGEVLGFLGPNGAGKSTSMQMITGNLAPTAGQITINGFDLIDQPIEAKSCIGYLPENPPVYRELTVIEYLSYCARLHRIPSTRLRSALDDAMQHCGLEQVGKRLIGNLSKGFQQRVGIAQAIIHQPPVVILDEPTVGLDPIQIREIRKLIKALGKDRSVILSTHILPEVQSICDRVQIIRRGELIYHATIDELNKRGQGNSLTVAFRHAPPVQELQQLAGIQHITALDEHRFQIQFEPDDFAEQLVSQSVQHHWGLFELIPDNTSLEQIFVELTTDEHPDLGTDAEQAA
ncbi:MAG: ATP-binding cassette domain-containing protein [Gammaproteobacteria bacterium]|nr:ATP-binding cassette domain-containing protein [Gammaproteobacteria bacterium]MBL7001088.1 ATP-binding cassette domain-containing protein [Gammaproteobacteria bacterium]